MKKNFKNKYVEIITDLIAQTDQGPAPLIEEGYLIDEDDEYIYLGSNRIEVSRRIRKNREIETQITKDPNEGMN